MFGFGISWVKKVMWQLNDKKAFLIYYNIRPIYTLSKFLKLTSNRVIGFSLYITAYLHIIGVSFFFEQISVKLTPVYETR